jgi:hypothetical protein
MLRTPTALVLAVAAVLCVGAVIVTKSVGHHTTCRQEPPGTSSIKLCTQKSGLW